MDLWLVLGLQAITLLGGVIAGAVALTLGGAGGLRSLRTRQDGLADAVERIDERITHEVKARASKAAVASRTDKELHEEAQRTLAAGNATSPNQRPSVASLGR